MALVTAPESWSEERVKIRRPSEWLVSYLRAARFAYGDAIRIALIESGLDDIPKNGQKLTTLLAKVLRIDVDAKRIDVVLPEGLRDLNRS